MDALYQRFGFQGYGQVEAGSWTTRGEDNSWEFPVILKYHLPFVVVHPFAGTGYAPRIVNGSEVTVGSYLDVPSGSYVPYAYRYENHYPVTHGLVLSGGADLDAGHIRFSPELRYEHWNAPFLNENGGHFQFVSAQDELLVLLGISWH